MTAGDPDDLVAAVTENQHRTAALTAQSGLAGEHERDIPKDLTGSTSSPDDLAAIITPTENGAPNP